MILKTDTPLRTKYCFLSYRDCCSSVHIVLPAAVPILQVGKDESIATRHQTFNVYIYIYICICINVK